jgi:hypothetical protein
MISEQHIRGNADMSEQSRVFCAGVMITVGLFFAVVCVALRGATMNAQNILTLLDKICDRCDAWFNPQLLPTHFSTGPMGPNTTDKAAVSIVLVSHLAEMGKGVASSIRLPRSISAGSLGLRIRSPPTTPQFSDRIDLFMVASASKQEV